MQRRHPLPLGIAVATCLWIGLAHGEDPSPTVGACSKTSIVLRQACYIDLGVNYREASAACLNIGDSGDRADCYVDARQDWKDSADDCGATFDAREAVCDAVGQAPYEPQFGAEYASNFVADPLQIGSSVAANPYYPLVPGSYWKYDNGDEIDIVTVTDKTKLIDGINCLVVHDVVSVDDVVTEDTNDWVAQDLQGNVWYCGEIAGDYETFAGDVPKEPELVAIDGSWKAGRDGAKAGILMPANPQVGTTFRSEVLWGEAEDAVEILDTAADETVEAASCGHACVQTRDFTALEPDAEENKFYAPGVGLILEASTDERNELVEYSIPSAP